MRPFRSLPRPRPWVPLIWLAAAMPRLSAQDLPAVRMTEILAVNQSGLRDEDGDTSDWIELYNSGSSAVRLDGWSLTDDDEKPRKWRFPSLEIGPTSYLVVYASGKDRRLPPLTWRTPITRRDLWRYRLGTSEPPSNWAELGFVDSAWTEAPSGFGYGDGDDETLIQDGLSVYVRKTFAIDSAANVGRMVLHVDYDDGFVAYLNGSEVARANLGEPGERPAYNTPAREAIEPLMTQGLLPQAFEIDLAEGLLRDGENVLAIQVHNVSLSSTDLTLIPFLSIGFFDPPSEPGRVETAFLPQLERRLHTNFSLSGEGEYLALFAPGGSDPVSAFEPAYPIQFADVSYGASASGIGYLQEPTPGAANLGGWNAVTEPPVFSVERGLYDAPFLLTIHGASPADQVWYTRDGSAPVPGIAFPYSDPLSIESTAIVRAIAVRDGAMASEVATHTYLFVPDVAIQSLTGKAPPGWPTTWGGNVVDYGMDPDVVGTPGSAARNTVLEALRSLPSLSLATDLDHLFDPVTGIYANPKPRGTDWERPVSVELLPHEGVEGFQIDARLRIRGGYSRELTNPKHAFRLFFRQRPLRYPLFGTEGADSFSNLDLRTAQNYSWSYAGDERNIMNRDVFSRDLQRDLQEPYTRSRYYHLYIDGQYWGIYQSQERPEADFGETHLGGSADHFDVLKSTERAEGWYDLEATDGDLEAWTRLWRLANDLADAPTPGQKLTLYREMRGLGTDGRRDPALPVLLDVDNLIRYMLVIFYAGNLDAPLAMDGANVNNFYSLRNRAGDRGFIHLAHDAEHTLLDVTENRTGPFPAGQTFIESNPQWIHQQLTTLEDYRLRFADIAHALLRSGGALSAEPSIARFLSRAGEIERAIPAESARWGDSKRHPPFRRQDWQNEIDRITNAYFPVRSAIVLEQLKEAQRYADWRRGPAGPTLAAPLYPTLDPPRFDRENGTVQAGAILTLTAEAGRIVYATGGRDPRLDGGAMAPYAVEADTLSSGGGARLRVAARAFRDGEWSALSVGDFYVGILPPTGGALRLSEIMFHPPAPTPFERDAGFTDDSDFEFVELTNVGGGPVSTGGLVLDGGISAQLPEAVLAAGESVVIGREPEALRTRYGTGFRVLGSYTGRLANEGESVILRAEPGGHELDRVAYVAKDAGPADGHGSSLGVESGSPTTAWAPSKTYGGSPGRLEAPAPNAVRISEVGRGRTVEPFVELTSIGSDPVDVGGWWLGRSDRWLRFPDVAVLPAAGHLAVSASALGTTPETLRGLLADGCFLVQTDGEGRPQRFVDVIRPPATDDGSLIRWGEAPADWFPAIEPTPGAANADVRIGPVVIREIMPQPLRDDLNLEYLEIENISPESIDLSGWRFSDGVSFGFPADFVLPAGASRLLVSFDPAAEAGRRGVFATSYAFPGEAVPVGGWTGRLRNTGERIALERPLVADLGTAWSLVDQVTFATQAPWPADALGTGLALRKESAASFSEDPGNWISVRRQRAPTVDPEVEVDGMRLTGPWPNPASTTARVTLAVEFEQEVTLELFDLLGRRVLVVRRDVLPARREKTFAVDLHGLSSGVYLLRAAGARIARTTMITVVH